MKTNGKVRARNCTGVRTSDGSLTDRRAVDAMDRNVSEQTRTDGMMTCQVDEWLMNIQL